jgi:hypothetical protein
MGQPLKANRLDAKAVDGDLMTEQNRKYIKKEIGKLLSEIWRIKGLAEQEHGQQHPITNKLISMHTDLQELLQEK